LYQGNFGLGFGTGHVSWACSFVLKCCSEQAAAVCYRVVRVEVELVLRDLNAAVALIRAAL